MISQVFSTVVLLGCIFRTNADFLKSQHEKDNIINEEIQSWRGPVACDVKRIEYNLGRKVRTDEFEDMFVCDDGVDRHEIVGIDDELLTELNSVDHPLPLIGDGVLFHDGPKGKRIDLSDASVSIDEDRRLQIENYFSISVTKGIRKAIAIRVSTTAGETVDGDLVSSIFGSGPNDPSNLLTQIEECSYSLLSIVPATELNVTSGVLDVTVNQGAAAVEATLIQDAARSAALGLVDLDSYDHVLYCLPAGTTFTPKGSAVAITDWTSYGELKGSESVYNDAACLSLSEQMYNIGLNLGLRNANMERDERGDGTGYMGDSSSAGAQKCYNAYNSYKLGWYANRHKLLYPKRWTSYVGDEDGRIINLAPIIQYKLTSRYHTIVGKIPLSGMAGNLYLSYNEKAGFNGGTETTADQVSIVWGSSLQQSVLIGQIGSGETFTWDSYNGGLMDLTITCRSIVTTGVPNTATVSVTLRS